MLSTLIFGMMLVFIFSFAFQLADLQTAETFPAVLWVSIFFSGMLALQRSFAKEKDQGALEGLLLACGDRNILFIAKLATSLTMLIACELVIVPLLWVFLEVQVVAMNWWLFFISLLLGSFGFAALGTLLNAITMQLPNSRLLFPILLFPLLIPILIGAILCMQGALNGEFKTVLGWIYVLLACDFLFTIIPLFLFEYVLEG